ncbi:TerD family protein [Streptomyces hainanensis]|uniref:TerD family protein n=1 Tax=Streptomyces hainanensis TaxID=402648 RepID=A0A4R4TL80_9ACTN|nr:TerD family protein [Streptomyces hainanensis]TDC78788.1 TerD family protein [Streptomyces hainanensis]
MGVSLSKGGNVSLTKQAPNLTAVTVGLGWQARATSGADFDLDASALLVNARGRVLSDRHFVFFNNLKSPDGAVTHMGDELVGGAGSAAGVGGVGGLDGAGGDQEEIVVDLAALPAEVDRVVFPVSIYDADARRQSFGQVTGAFIRIANQADGGELARYDLTEDASSETAMVFGELYRREAEWKFRAVGQGYASGLRGIAADYGVNV